MKSILPKSVEKLSEVLASLPGVGPKTANRLTFYLLGRNDEELKKFGEAFGTLKDNLTICSQCFIVTETDPCPICADDTRERTKMAVVEEPLDVLALEKAHFNGIYHVLGGQISPINNVGPEDLKIKELLERLTTDDFKEVILAMDPTLEGEATVMYVDEKIAEARHGRKGAAKLIVSRLARGLPVGGDLEYADELTLTRALEGRRSYSSPD
ncbi:recombination protein RecR [Candidatus Berkelbacteria bacterium RIFCSPLOWO2_01_FULL_50_28]|uniref:Recombination protein RecR n=1 Tax=Candidatus Berkelbacteria bacterium RIFCSPLOWO2_01_FULL_50_28 TaxID=1797471 RepID=A0A1F5EBN4_9BACT|nr:MAG: recombination protein RecR [Candidatus Berkelbacteria bacterium RIFCSPHIGHO2_12_FULL_50_11]OGD64795.1 MAG: recombination protein RecR [Candidatus Berkelbacteria bacterium RIFCSPLOWO2_01_FULL_50_28]